MNTEYNGYKNYETWNVSLWINNDENLYNIAKECHTYTEFMQKMYLQGSFETPDRVLWTDQTLDVKTLNEQIRELQNEKGV